MQITELKIKYPKVYEAALFEFCYSCGFKLKDSEAVSLFEKGTIANGFSWMYSLEGPEFWVYIHFRNFTEAKSLIPEYF